jgi:4-amino-4-deoxy-L-arabinose transferase-like glycosyltransferase
MSCLPKSRKDLSILLTNPKTIFRTICYYKGMDNQSVIKKSIFIGTGAMIVRLIHLILTLKYNPLSGDLLLDARIYHQWAVALISGGGPVTTRFMQSPLYPWLLSVIYRISGPKPDAIFLFQAIAGAISCSLIVIITKRMFKSTGAAVTAGIAGAIYLPFIFYQGILVPATIIILLNLIFILLLLPAAKPAGNGRILATGIVLGLSVMAKPVSMLLLPFALIHIMTYKTNPADTDKNQEGEYTTVPPAGESNKTSGGISGNHSNIKSKSGSILIIMLGIVLAICPVTIRNAVLTGEFIPLTTGGGINFYIGNNSKANGYYSVPTYQGHSLGSTPEKQWYMMNQVASRERGKRLSRQEVSSFWLDKGLRYINRHPEKWIKLLWLKFIIFWNGYERANIDSFHFQRGLPGILGLPLLTFGIVAPLGILGIFLTRNRWRSLWLLYGGIITYLLAALIFYVLARYRLPVVPFLLPFVGAALFEILSLARSKKIYELVLTMAAAGLLFFFSNITVARDTDKGISKNLTRLGRLYLERGETVRAVSSFEEALKLDPANREAARRLKKQQRNIPD